MISIQLQKIEINHDIYIYHGFDKLSTISTHSINNIYYGFYKVSAINTQIINNANCIETQLKELDKCSPRSAEYRRTIKYKA